jgi:hypothetical protein
MQVLGGGQDHGAVARGRESQEELSAAGDGDGGVRNYGVEMTR